MPEPEKITQAQDLILALNEARQKEIETVRIRMEKFLEGQIELKHEMNIVATNQTNLKERFEMGVSKTLANLDKKFDQFMVEWGKKEKEDELRDERIQEAKGDAKAARDKSDFFVRSVVITVCSSLVLVALIWGIKTILD